MQAHLISTFQAHQKRINELTVIQTPHLVISSSAEQTLRVWSLRTSNLQNELIGHHAQPSSIAAFPYGSFVVSGSLDGIIIIWNGETGEHIRTLRQHKRRVTALGVAPDGKHFVSGDEAGVVCIWNSVSGQLRHVCQNPARITAMTLTPDGRYVLVSSSDDESSLSVWDLNTGALYRRFTQVHHGIANMAIAQDGNHLITGSLDGDVTIWHWAEGEAVRTIETHLGTAVTALMPNRRYAIIGTQKPRLTIWNLETGRHIHTLDTPSDWVSSLAITPDGRHILAGCHNGMLNVYQLSH